MNTYIIIIHVHDQHSEEGTAAIHVHDQHSEEGTAAISDRHGTAILVPAGGEVQQAPSKIPPVFNGDRLVMYAVLKTKDRSSSLGQCKAVLSGKICGKDVEHSLEFCIGIAKNVHGLSFPICPSPGRQEHHQGLGED